MQENKQNSERRQNPLFSASSCVCCFRLRTDEVKLSRERRRFVMGGIQRNGEEGGSGRTEIAVIESRKETADRVARYQTDHEGRTCLCYSYHKLLRLPRRCFC